MRDPRPTLPEHASKALAWLLAVGAVLGLLCGAGVFSGGVGIFLLYGAPLVFVPWAVLQMSPRRLSQRSSGGEG
jgi:hypothetical protein